MKDATFVRVWIDRKSSVELDRWAAEDHRTKASQLGWILRQVARMYEERPDLLRQIGLLPGVAQHPLT